ncbi:MAG: hypothetical protein ACHQ7M_01595 [Chloroflexota bacterium]
MATRKVTVTLDEDVYQAIKNNTKNVSAAVNKLAIHWVAMEKQRRALEELEREWASKEDDADPQQLDRMMEFLDKITDTAKNAHQGDR